MAAARSVEKAVRGAVTFEPRLAGVAPLAVLLERDLTDRDRLSLETWDVALHRHRHAAALDPLVRTEPTPCPGAQSPEHVADAGRAVAGAAVDRVAGVNASVAGVRFALRHPVPPVR